MGSSSVSEEQTLVYSRKKRKEEKISFCSCKKAEEEEKIKRLASSSTHTISLQLRRAGWEVGEEEMEGGDYGWEVGGGGVRKGGREGGERERDTHRERVEKGREGGEGGWEREGGRGERREGGGGVAGRYLLPNDNIYKVATTGGPGSLGDEAITCMTQTHSFSITLTASDLPVRELRQPKMRRWKFRGGGGGG